MKLVHCADLPSPALCGCGCGARVGLARVTNTARGWIKGQPLRALTGHALSRPPRKDPVARFWALVEKTESCWLWKGGSRAYRYGAFRLDPGKSMVAAHRYSWELLRGPIPEGLFVLHNCPGGDNSFCVNPDRLFLGTQQENVQDCFSKGRMPRGAQRASARLTDDLVRQARVLVKNGRSVYSLAKELGISSASLRKAVLGITWDWVK